MKIFFDALANLVTGMGGEKSKSSATTYAYSGMTVPELEAAYRGSWLARKVIDIPALDMCREWRSWQAAEKQIEALEREETRLSVKAKVLEAKIKARLYGGAAILIGDGSTDLEDELRPDRIRQGGLLFLTVMTCHRLSAGIIETDPMLATYGWPRDYVLQAADGQQIRLHPSRLVRFIGNQSPDPERALSMGWGDPVLDSVSKALKDAETVAANIAELTHEAKVDVFRVPHLMQLAADADYESRFLRRMSLASVGKSMHHALIMDAEEQYEQKQISFATLPEVLDRMLQIAAGAADIPMTRLLGMSPAGMNATGESDIRNYYDRLIGRKRAHAWLKRRLGLFGEIDSVAFRLGFV